MAAHGLCGRWHRRLDTVATQIAYYLTARTYYSCRSDVFGESDEIDVHVETRQIEKRRSYNWYTSQHGPTSYGHRVRFHGHTKGYGALYGYCQRVQFGNRRNYRGWPGCLIGPRYKQDDCPSGLQTGTIESLMEDYVITKAKAIVTGSEAAKTATKRWLFFEFLQHRRNMRLCLDAALSAKIRR